MNETTTADAAPRSDETDRSRIGWGWILANGILSVLIGLIAMLWPVPATFAATLIFGALLVASGIGAFVAAFGGKRHETRWYDALFGILSVIVGILVVFKPFLGALSLTLLAVSWLWVRGALEIYWAFRFRRNRWLMLLLGVVNLVLGWFILATIPFTALTLPGFILGVSFLVGGITEISIALGWRKETVPAAAPPEPADTTQKPADA